MNSYRTFNFKRQTMLTLMSLVSIVVAAKGEVRHIETGDWDVSLMPSLRVSQMESAFAFSGLTETIELSCDDFVDSPDIVWMGQLESRNKTNDWGFTFDSMYLSSGLYNEFELNSPAKSQLADSMSERSINCDIRTGADAGMILSDDGLAYRPKELSLYEDEVNRPVFGSGGESFKRSTLH